MSKLTIKSIDGPCRYMIRAEFIYYFQMDPPDCNKYAFFDSYKAPHVMMAVGEFFKDFANKYDFQYVRDCTIQIEIEPEHTTTFE